MSRSKVTIHKISADWILDQKRRVTFDLTTTSKYIIFETYMYSESASETDHVANFILSSIVVTSPNTATNSTPGTGLQKVFSSEKWDLFSGCLVRGLSPKNNHVLVNTSKFG